MITLHFSFFIMLSTLKQKRFQVLMIICFVLLSILVRFSVPFDKNPDYINYVQRDYLFQGDVSDLLEPLTKLFYTVSNFLGFNHVDSIENLYRINFILSSFFFCYLATTSEVKFWVKIIFFSFFYFFATYVVIRNAPLFFLLAYFLLKKKKINLARTMALFSTHISSIIVPVINLLSKLSTYVMVVFGALLIVLIPKIIEAILNNSELFGSLSIYLDYFSLNGEISFNHIFLLLFNLSFFFAVCLISGVKNISKLTWASFIIYLFGFAVNPVIGARLSLYMIIFLLFTTNNFFSKISSKSNHRVFNFFLIPLCLAYTIFIFFDIHEY